MGEKKSARKGQAKSALLKTIRQIIQNDALMAMPEMRKAVIKACKKYRYYSGIELMIDKKHIHKGKAHGMMAWWAFKDGNTDLCRKYLGKECNLVDHTPQNIAIYLACKSGDTDSMKKMKSLLALGKYTLKELGAIHGIIQCKKSHRRSQTPCSTAYLAGRRGVNADARMA